MQDNNRNESWQQPQHNEQAKSGDGHIQGRVDNSGNAQFKDEEAKADISHVDRQEGTMNNGVLGGNFNTAESENT